MPDLTHFDLWVGWWGPALLILGAMFYLVIKPPGWLMMLVQTQVDHAEATKAQAVATSELAEAVKASMARDDFERQETLGVLRVVAEDLREMKQQLRTGGH